MPVGYVLDTGARLADFYGAVFDDGRGAAWVEGFEVRGRQEGGAGVGYQVVGDGELFAEPGEALGLGGVEVVDFEGHDCFACRLFFWDFDGM